LYFQKTTNNQKVIDGFLTEIVGSIIDRVADFVGGEVAESTTWKEWKIRNALSKKDNDFLDIYVEAVVVFVQKDKDESLKKFFRQQSVIDALKDHWYGGKTRLPFYDSIKN
jgi:hypothetical protein